MTVVETSFSSLSPSSLSPAEALHASGIVLPVLPPCVHYAGTEKFILKALELQATTKLPFDICCDLEDGAARGGEEAHLENVVSILKTRTTGGRAGVRIHDVQSAFWWNELEVLLAELGDRLAFITLPKCRGRRDVEIVLQEMFTLKARLKLPTLPPLHVLIETHGALEDVRAIAKLPGLEALEFGLMDFISEHQGAIPEECLRSPGQFEHQLLIRAKTEIAAAALAHGLVPVHNISLDLANPDVVRADALTAHRFFGFLRMWSIHPSQIAPICEAFTPDFSQLETARAILSAAEKANWAPIRHEGRLVDRASYRLYWNMLRRAELYGSAR